MSTQLSDYRLLCETLEFLCVDVLSRRNIRSIMDDLRNGKNDWDERNVKVPARDSTFRLLYLFLLGEFESDVRDSNMAIGAMLFFAFLAFLAFDLRDKGPH